LAELWHYSVDGKTRRGPTSLEDMRELAARGVLRGEHFVWREGWTDWRPAQGVAELFPPAVVHAPPNPQPPNPPAPRPAFRPARGPAASERAAGGIWWHCKLHLRRALASDLKAIEVRPQEAETLAANGVSLERAQKYVVWRASMLLIVIVPSVLSAIIGLYRVFDTFKYLNAVGALAYLLQALALVALPAAVGAAAWSWMRIRDSRRLLMYGWGVAFIVPAIVALAPADWVLNEFTLVDRAALALTEILNFMPIVLCLIPGVVRGCLRIKTLLPQSIVPGWFLMAAAFSYALALLPMVVFVSKFSGSLLLFLACGAWLAAPLSYLGYARTFVTPQETYHGERAVRRARSVSFAMVVSALALALLFAFTFKMGSRTALGLSEAGSVFRPWDWDILKFLVEYSGRTLFITVLAVDVFMTINVSVWLNARRFLLSPRGEEYDQVVRGLEKILTGSRGIWIDDGQETAAEQDEPADET
jgi:hypothetical protein